MRSHWNAPLTGLLLLVAAAQSHTETHVFILAGQSNMVGKGEHDLLPDSLKGWPANVWPNFSSRRTFGPEIGFAHAISDLWPEDTIMLVKFAEGATSIYCWQPVFHAESTAVTNNTCDTLYTRLLEHVTEATDDRDVRFEGMLWMQGERDAKYPRAGNLYLTNLHTLIDSIRADVATPAMPFILGRIVAPSYAARDTVRWAQEEVQNTREKVRMVDTDDLSFLDDDLHYDTEGQAVLGKRFAEAYIELTQPTGNTRPGPTKSASPVSGNSNHRVTASRRIVASPSPQGSAREQVYSIRGRRVAPGAATGGYEPRTLPAAGCWIVTPTDH
jgi:hypothetical protein